MKRWKSLIWPPCVSTQHEREMTKQDIDHPGRGLFRMQDDLSKRKLGNMIQALFPFEPVFSQAYARSDASFRYQRHQMQTTSHRESLFATDDLTSERVCAD